MDARSHQRMTLESLTDRARAQPIVTAAIAVAVGGAATILGAWFFQYALGYQPCPLCLEQRYPYYFAIPLAVLILMGSSVGSRRRILLAGLAAIAGLMLWNAGLAGFHAGVEWKWWLGPTTCSGSVDLGGGNLLNELQSIHVPRCDDAAWRDPVIGLSLAGYNVLISLALAAVAAWGFVGGRRLPPQRD